MRITVIRTIVFLLFFILIISCATNRILNLDTLSEIESSDVIGLYKRNMRRHHTEIYLQKDYSFKYKLNSNLTKQYYKGFYTLNGNLLTLKSDSSFSQLFLDIKNNKEETFTIGWDSLEFEYEVTKEGKIIRNAVDSSKFEYVVTKKGLHEKLDDKNFMEECSFKKKK